MRFHPDSDMRQLTARWHRFPRAQAHPLNTDSLSGAQSGDDEAEIAKATVCASAGTLVLLLVVLGVIAFGQEAMHWLGVR